MPKLALSDEEWMRALIFLGMRAADLCTEDAYSHALKYFMRYQSVEEHFTQKIIDQITMPNKNIVTLHALLGGSSVGRIEGEIIYQAIDAAAREKLESLNILKHPFKAINVELNK